MDLQWDNCWIWWINPRLEKAKFHLSCMTKLYREMDFINKQRTVNIIARLWMFMQIKIREDLKLKVEICFKKYHDKVMKYLKISNINEILLSNFFFRSLKLEMINRIINKTCIFPFFVIKIILQLATKAINFDIKIPNIETQLRNNHLIII